VFLWSCPLLVSSTCIFNENNNNNNNSIEVWSPRILASQEAIKYKIQNAVSFYYFPEQIKTSTVGFCHVIHVLLHVPSLPTNMDISGDAPRTSRTVLEQARVKLPNHSHLRPNIKSFFPSCVCVCLSLSLKYNVH
jgi:hypothetical protein